VRDAREGESFGGGERRKRGRRRITGSGVVPRRVFGKRKKRVYCAMQGFTRVKFVILNIVRDIIVVSHLKMGAPSRQLYTLNLTLSLSSSTIKFLQGLENYTG
jgi:hypothetical protein